MTAITYAVLIIGTFLAARCAVRAAEDLQRQGLGEPIVLLATIPVDDDDTAQPGGTGQNQVKGDRPT